jgi:hypothetical protein
MLVQKKDLPTNSFKTEEFSGFSTFSVRVIIHFTKAANHPSRVYDIPMFEAKEYCHSQTKSVRFDKKVVLNIIESESCISQRLQEKALVETTKSLLSVQ